MSNSESFFLLYPSTRQRIAELGTTVEKLYLGAVAGHPIPGPATSCCSRDHGFRWNPGRNDIFGCSLPHDARQHGTTGYGHFWHQCVGRARSKETAFRVDQNSRGQSQDGHNPPVMGWTRASNRRRPVSRSITLKWKTCSLPGEYRWIRWMGLPGCSSSVFLPDPETGR